MLLVSFFLVAVLPDVAVFFPSSHDKDGWGLRLHNLSNCGPFLETENLEYLRCRVILINFSKEVRHHDSLEVAVDARDLAVSIFHANGDRVPHQNTREGLVGVKPPQVKLQPGAFVSHEVKRFNHLNYFRAPQKAGEYRAELALLIDEKTKQHVKAPPLKFEVVGLSSKEILASHPIKQGGWILKRPPEDRSHAVVEQILIRDRTWLFYRRFGPSRFGGTVESTFRITELPGTVEMKVTGIDGDEGPITITYKDKHAPGGTTTLLVHSAGGTPWTARNQDSYNFEHNIAPAPRPKP